MIQDHSKLRQSASFTDMSCEYNDRLSSSSCKECNESSSTPFATAPSSPKKHFLCTSSNDAVSACSRSLESACSPSDFDFSERIRESGLSLPSAGSLNPACSAVMSSAEELFQNGQIKPLNARFSVCICCSQAVECGGPYDVAVSGHLNAMFSADICCSQAECGGPYEVSGHLYDPPCPHRHGQASKLPLSDSRSRRWRKAVDGNNDKGISAALHAQAYPRVARVTQMPSLALASYGKSAGSGHLHRRARSLSPSRVFHMDDVIQAPRPSFESELYTRKSSLHAESKFALAITRPRRRRRSSSRKSWTLKELLNLGDNKVHDKRPQAGSKGSSHHPAKLERKAGSLNMERAALEIKVVEDKVTSTSSADGNINSKSSMPLLNERGILSCSPWNLQRVLKRGDDEGAVHAADQERKKQTLLSDKRGLLGCLQGITSKLSSVRGVQGTSHCNEL